MKRIIWIAVLALAFAACKNNNEFTISGTIKNAGDLKKVRLFQTDSLIDSAFVNESGEFRFTRINPDPDFYSLEIGDKNFVLIAKNGDEIDFETDYTDQTNTYTASGSEESEKIRKFHKLGNAYGAKTKEIEADYQKMMSASSNANRDSIMQILMPRLQKNMDDFAREALKFAETNKDNLAGFYAAGSIDQVKYEQPLIKFAEDIKPRFPNNKAVKSFVARMESVKVVSIGQQAPEFSLPDVSGKQTKLSDFKGKYVLLDFWASWCGPCRRENPNIVRLHDLYKAKNFTVLGVSLDDNREDWLKAIKDDNLNWTQVTEMKRWDSETAALYKVDGIPASFILDPNGKIIGKNLSGADLEEFLKKNIK